MSKNAKSLTELTPKQEEVYGLYKKYNNNINLVADDLGMQRNSVIKHLAFIAIKGYPITPDNHSPIAPPGWTSVYKTVQHKDSDGNTTWDRIRPEQLSIDLLIDSLKDRTPINELIIAPPAQNDIQKDVCLLWPCVDMHVGLAAWKPETLDSNYNLKTSKKLEDAATIEMLKKVGPVEHIHLAFLGDNTHTDNRTNQTEKNANILDVDSRYPKIIWACRDIICNKIEKSLAYANTVSVDIVQGNHDPNTAVCMLAIIDAYYRNEKRVKINISHSQFKFFQWGVSIAMGCHGDEAPPARLGALLMDYVIQNEIKVKDLYVFKGHVHHRKAGLIPGIDEVDGGVLVETFPTLTAKDGWHASKAYSARRASVSKLFHKEYGLIDDYKVNAKYLAYKYNI
jgi:hypothetical protein